MAHICNVNCLIFSTTGLFLSQKFPIGHFDVMRLIGSVLSRNASWDSFKGAIWSFIGYYMVT